MRAWGAPHSRCFLCALRERFAHVAMEEFVLGVGWSNTWTSVHWSKLAWRENDWAHKRTRWEAPGKVDSVAVARVRDGCVCQRMHHNEHVRANENLSLFLVLLHLSRERENEQTVFALKLIIAASRFMVIATMAHWSGGSG